MSDYSVAEAKAKLSELIDRAEKGEGVRITRHGRAVIEFKPVRPTPRRMEAADLAQLAERRAARKVKGSPVQFMLNLRDEGDL